jgi:hypothetical protein
MNLCLKILKTIIDAEEPISPYAISKSLGESYNSVKYNIQKLEDHKTILALKRKDKPNATYYVPNEFFTEMDVILEYLNPIILEALRTTEMNENNAKFNFKRLFELIINEVIVNGKNTHNIPETNEERPKRRTARLTET